MDRSFLLVHFSFVLFLINHFMICFGNFLRFYIFIKFIWKFIKKQGQDFIPVLTIKKPFNPLTVNLLYVACPDIDTIFQVCTPKNNLCGSIGVKGRPTYLGIDKLRNRLLALVPDQRAIKIIDLVTNKVTNSLRIPLIVEPSYMVISEDGEHAFVLEGKRNFLYRFDLISGDLEERVAICQHPNYLTYF